MPARVRWGAGVEECKLHLWEFWKKCVSLKRASAQHTQKIDSLPSSSLSELPPGLSQEILLKGSLFVHPFYTKNAFFFTYSIYGNSSLRYTESSLAHVHWTSSVWNWWAQQQQCIWRTVWMNAWTLLPGSLQAIGVFQGCEGLPLNQYCDLTTLVYHCYRRNR